MKTRFITAIILTIAMLCSTVASAAAPQVGDVTEVPNASFENLKADGFAADWSPMTTDTCKIEIDATRAHTGKNSLKISTDAGGNPWACTTVSGLYPGGVYEIGVYVNTQLTNVGGRGAGFKIEHYKNDGTGAGGDSVGDTYTQSTNAQWTLLSTSFTVPEGAEKTKVYCRLYCNGTAWFDDLAVKFTGGPEKFSFYSDHCFLYPDEEGGGAEVNLNAFYSNTTIGEEHTVDFAIMDGDKAMDEAKGVRFANGKAVYKYTIDKVPEMHKKYLLTATVHETATGNIVGEYYDNLYKYERPTSMTPENDFVIGGEKIRPLLAYHCGTNSYEKMAPLGVNVVQTSYAIAVYDNVELRENVLNALDANGMKALCCLYIDMKMAGSPQNIENTKKLVAEYKDDPRIFAWAVMDEPLGSVASRENKDLLEASYIAIRELDPYHPIYVLDYGNHLETSKYCDVYVADIYCAGTDTTFVSKIIDELNQRKRVNTYELAQSFSPSKVMPLIGAVRNSIYRAFEGGARGVGYYSIDDAYAQDSQTGETKPIFETDLWDDFATFNKEEVPILFDRFTSGKAVPFNSFTEGEALRELMWYDWFIDGQMYLVAHNRGQATVKADIPLRSKNGLISIDGFTAEPIGISEKKTIKGNGSISLELGTEEVCLFKITPDAAVDLSRISDSRYSDLDGYDWASDAINALTDDSIVTPAAEGSFAPAREVTRGELGMFLVRALGLSANAADNFADVAQDAPYAKELAIGKVLGILKGVGDNLYQPENSITRQDLMTLCARGMTYAQKLAAADMTVLDAFGDKDGVADYARESVAAMIKSGIINGDENGNLNPRGTATRAEAAVIMQRIMQAKTVSVATQEAPQEALPEITFTDKPTEAQVATWNEAAAFLAAMGAPAVKDVTAGIRCGEFEAILSGCLGYAYNGFEDDSAPLTYDSAVKGLVDVLGYGVQLSNDGEYLAKAAQIELTKGIEATAADAPVRTGVALELIDNAMDIPLLVQSGYGAGATQTYAESNKTLLTRQKISKKDGCINATYYNAFNTAPCGKNQLALDGEVFDSVIDPVPYLGYRVSLYIREGNEVVYIRETNKTIVTVVNGNDVLPDSTTKTRLSYTDANDRVRSIAIPTDAALLYNGIQTETWTKADLTPETGTITIIENGSGDVDLIMVDVYTDYVVKQIDAKKQTVYFKDGGSCELNPENVRLRMTDTDGKPVTVDACKEWNILSIVGGIDSVQHGTVRAILSTKEVTGETTELLSDGVRIADKEYKYAETADIMPNIGDVAVFYLNYADEIVAMDSTGAVPNYGYYVGIAEEGNVDKHVAVRIFTADGKMQTFNARERIDFNGVSTEAKALLTNRIMTVSGRARDQLVIYEISENNELLGITTAVDGTELPDDEKKAVFTRDCNTGTTALSRCTGFTVRIFAQKYVITSQTVTFIVPETYSDNEADYAIRAASYYKHGSRYDNATIYDVDRDQNIGAVVQKTISAVDIGNEGSQAIVLGPRTVLTEDGEAVVAVGIITQDGEEKTLPFTSNTFPIYLGSAKTLTSSATESEVTLTAMGTRVVNETITPDKLCRGDVILYQTDSKNYAAGVRVLLRANSPAFKELSAEGMGEDYDYSNLTRAYGVITKVTTNGIMMTPGAWERLYAYRADGNREAQVFLFDRAKDTITHVDKAEIKEGDKAFVSRNNCYTNIIVLYR